ncbi:MAG: DUF4942 domain-containing protein [Gudongella sp.]|nr:DUF4942 domain-containing protein [Gudongella sp.]
MFSSNFYPTPRALIYKMLGKISLDQCRYILEPSAGKGDIVDLVRIRTENTRGYKPIVDTIEYNKELQATLKGKGFNLIHDDFLTFNTFKRYDLIIMNPPFENGDKHLLKALDIQRRGGEIVCILNAETIKNPYSNDRNKLLRLLEEYEAKIEFMENSFSDAERKTDVEIALVYVKVPKNYVDNLILDSLKNETKIRQSEQNNSLISKDPMENAIQRYNFEVEVGLNLIYNYNSLGKIIVDNLKEDSYSNPILELTVKNNKNSGLSVVNDYIEQVRFKYWQGLIDMDKFRQILTTNLISEFHDKLDDLKQFDFTRFNIQQVIKELEANLVISVEDTIYQLFKDFTRRYSQEEYSSNVHLFDGWKTNKCYKINDKKVILPYLKGFDGYNGEFYPEFGVEGRIRDIEKSLNYLDGGKTDSSDDIRDILAKARENNQFKKVEFKYFYIDFFRKGTGHIIWKDKELIKKLNIFGSRKEGSLPPSYGRKDYKDMTKEEKAVIDNFEGEKEYKRTMTDTKYYLYESGSLLMLGGVV